MSQDAAELLRRAYACQMEGNLEEAIRLYKESIAVEPTAEAHTYLGWTFSFQNRYAEAIRECLRAIEVDPAFGNPYNDIGAYLIEMGRWEESVSWFEKALEAPRYDPRHFPHFNLARVHIQSCDYGRAIVHLKKALELEPGYESARRELARLTARMN